MTTIPRCPPTEIAGPLRRSTECVSCCLASNITCNVSLLASVRLFSLAVSSFLEQTVKKIVICLAGFPSPGILVYVQVTWQHIRKWTHKLAALAIS